MWTLGFKLIDIVSNMKQCRALNTTPALASLASVMVKYGNSYTLIRNHPELRYLLTSCLQHGARLRRLESEAL
jgi:hypothetical protein